MNNNQHFYLLHICSFAKSTAVLVEFYEERITNSEYTSFSDLQDKLKRDSRLIVFLPSTELMTYPLSEELLDKKDLFESAFYDSYGKHIVGDFSTQKLVKNSVGKKVYIFDSSVLGLLKPITAAFLGEIYVYPENLLLQNSLEFNAFSFYDRTAWIVEGGTFLGALNRQETQMLNLIQKTYPQFNLKKTILIEKEDEGFDEAFELTQASNDLYTTFINTYDWNFPNFFSSGFSLNTVKKKLKLARKQVLFVILLVILALALPEINKVVLKSYQQKYQKATLMLLKQLDPNISQLINVKAQFNQVSGGVSEFNTAIADNAYLLEQITKYQQYFSAIEIDQDKKVLNLHLKNKPDSRFKILLGLLKSQGIRPIDSNDISDETYIVLSFGDINE